MKRAFKYGSYRYEYQLIFEERRTFTLIVEPDLTIILRAPHGTTDTKIDQFLTKKWNWLRKQLKELEGYQEAHRQKAYLSGEAFHYLGRQYMLLVVHGPQDVVTVRPGKICITTTQAVRNGAYNKLLLTQWLRLRQRIVFKQQYVKALKLFGLEAVPRLEIKSMMRRWGSYTKTGTVILNPRLIEAPTDAIHYVLVHELCHIISNHHDEQFYRELEKRIPEWKKIKHKLEFKYGK